MSRIEFKKVAVVGATGPTGTALIDVLREHSVSLRAVSRSASKHAFPGESVEQRSGNALDAASLAAAVEGCDLIVNCIGLGPDQMHLHPEAAHNLVAAARREHARIVQVSSFWAYLPLTREVLTEDHPRTGGPPWVRFRREAEDIHLEAGGAVVNLPDFYGPRVHTGTLQQALEGALENGVMNWIGAADVEREYAYVPDAMQILGNLVMREQAYGQTWIFPGGGPLSGRRLAQIAEGTLGRKVQVRAAGPWLLRILSWFKRDLRDFMQMVPDYVKPIRYDASRLRTLLGDLPDTDYEDTIAETVESLRTT